LFGVVPPTHPQTKNNPDVSSRVHLTHSTVFLLVLCLSFFRTPVPLLDVPYNNRTCHNGIDPPRKSFFYDRPLTTYALLGLYCPTIPSLSRNFDASNPPPPPPPPNTTSSECETVKLCPRPCPGPPAQSLPLTSLPLHTPQNPAPTLCFLFFFFFFFFSGVFPPALGSVFFPF